ncbi:MAG: hypothetical protein VCC04_09365 [Myxococcota bacterium]
MSRGQVPDRGGAPGQDWTRRDFLIGAGALWGASSLALPARVLAEATATFSLSAEAKAALTKTPLVYISPLLAGGGESRCHGEVWFFDDEGDVVIFASKESWKVRALALGRDQARIWVGDFGPVSGAGDRYRKAPNFLSQAELDPSSEAFERLMKSYSQRYADEWGKWGPRFRKGYEEGTRTLIRYRPVAA